ncbi:hypothetical protein CPB84DRAFT_1790423 [Gymnopilus junonius]|uniref:Uncharacterized protein n=1 Tax=Gymnopilus junonius TaxID=109634 RepID=A0A9P5NFG9_GYMJU|nr:hypothetical protein CPB84DRAFT_1790423 [Gymnopilus junonius]
MDVAGLGPVSYFEAEAEFLILDLALDIPLPEEEGGEEDGMEVEVDQEDQEEEGEDEQNGRDEDEEDRDEEEKHGDEEDGDEEDRDEEEKHGDEEDGDEEDGDEEDEEDGDEEDEEDGDEEDEEDGDEEDEEDGDEEDDGYEEDEENEVIGNPNGLLTVKLNPNWRNRYFVVNYGLVLEYHNTPEGVHLGPIDIFRELFVLCGQEFLPAELGNHDKSVHLESCPHHYHDSDVESDDDGDNQWSDTNIDAQYHLAETYAPEYSSSSESLDLHMGRHSFLADHLDQTSSMQISLASFRTQSTEYGIYYRRMAISQDTLESYVYHDQNDFVIQL